ncbi:hypothetical protein PISMIDRAFT_340141 [Pisolithus microcarpus 441]|uniref:Unplaced genomic scaffold scaffold_23, whole genome shotgun sequence n=1 Tax=Pisolithus microcarpus 441 TaxID=765257 RepID=A0A0D0A0H7_9AGAM|nr:hypothetical protein BKA83DRAFT_340141 [Pisolithus microcarpus]KIK25543.1 hypothetical protein PISMIDRAFT_340141 [Pisolithus microcarpus 441]
MMARRHSLPRICIAYTTECSWISRQRYPSPMKEQPSTISLPDNRAAAIGLWPAHSTGNPQRTYPCPLGSGCAVPLEGTTTSVYRHLRRHGLIHGHRDRAPCPWPGCHKDISWGNVARHIVERHLGVKLPCTFCGKLYTRKDSLNAHMRVCVARTFGISDPGNC